MMKSKLNIILYPKSITRKITIFFILAILPIVLFSLINNGIQQFAEQNISSIRYNSLLEERELDEVNYETFNESFEQSKDEMNHIVGSSYVESEFVLRASIQARTENSMSSFSTNLFFIQSDGARDQFYNYYNTKPASFVKRSNEVGVYVSKKFLSDSSAYVGSNIYLYNQTTRDFSYSFKIIGYYNNVVEQRDKTFYIVMDDLSTINFECFNYCGAYSLHHLKDNINYSEFISLTSKIINNIKSKAEIKDDLIGTYVKVLNIGELFAIATSIAITLMMFYSIISRGEILIKIHRIQYVYYQSKNKVCMRFVLQNLLNYLIAVSLCLILATIIVLIVKLMYGFLFFVDTLTLIVILINAFLVVTASILSFCFNQKK